MVAEHPTRSPFGTPNRFSRTVAALRRRSGVTTFPSANSFNIEGAPASTLSTAAAIVFREHFGTPTRRRPTSSRSGRTQELSLRHEHRVQQRRQATGRSVSSPWICDRGPRALRVVGHLTLCHQPAASSIPPVLFVDEGCLRLRRSSPNVRADRPRGGVRVRDDQPGPSRRDPSTTTARSVPADGNSGEAMDVAPRSDATC